jgi:dynein light chain LC8-type
MFASFCAGRERASNSILPLVVPSIFSTGCTAAAASAGVAAAPPATAVVAVAPLPFLSYAAHARALPLMLAATHCSAPHLHAIGGAAIYAVAHCPYLTVHRAHTTGTMAERKAVIKNADMSEDMQQDAVDCASQALEKYNIEKDIAAFIKKEFDKKYNPTWHCIVGRNFGSYVTHETKHFIYFYLGQVSTQCLRVVTAVVISCVVFGMGGE